MTPADAQFLRDFHSPAWWTSACQKTGIICPPIMGPVETTPKQNAAFYKAIESIIDASDEVQRDTAAFEYEAICVVGFLRTRSMGRKRTAAQLAEQTAMVNQATEHARELIADPPAELGEATEYWIDQLRMCLGDH
jgi:hypothetical protein